jgi:uncharacterized membrane protein
MEIAHLSSGSSIWRSRDENDRQEKLLDFLNEIPMLLTLVIFQPRLGMGTTA